MGGGLSGMQPGLQQQLLMQHVGGAAAAGGVMAKAQDSGDVMAQVCLHAWAPALCIGLEALLPQSTGWGCFLDFAQLALAARGF